MFRLSKIIHHQVLPALVIHEQCAEILLVGGHEISFLKVKSKYMRESYCIYTGGWWVVSKSLCPHVILYVCWYSQNSKYVAYMS